MASRSATTERVNWALQQLIAGHGSTAVVTEMTQREGVSRRQAQRLTAKAHEILVTDLDSTERKHLVAQLVHILLEAGAQALKAKNSGAVVGVSKELRNLVGLSADNPGRNSRFGRHG